MDKLPELKTKVTDALSKLTSGAGDQWSSLMKKAIRASF